jgi:hypothetical protein
MAAGTFTVAGRRVRTSSTRRFVAFQVNRKFDGVRYGDVGRIEIFKRSDNVQALKTQIQRQGFHSSRYFVVIDTTTGEEVTA